MKRERKPSKIVAIRYHLDEIKEIDKKRKDIGRTIYIREKSLK